MLRVLNYRMSGSSVLFLDLKVFLSAFERDFKLLNTAKKVEMPERR